MSSVPPPPPPPPSVPPPNVSSKYQNSRPAPAATKASSSGEDLLSQLKSGKSLKKAPVGTSPKSIPSETKSKAPSSRTPQINPSSIYKPHKNDSMDRNAKEPASKKNSSRPPAIPASPPPKPSTLNPAKSIQGTRFPTPSTSRPNDLPPPLPRTVNANHPTNRNSPSIDNADESQRVKVSSSFQRKPVPPSSAKQGRSEESIASRIPQKSPPQTPPRIKAKTAPRNRNDSNAEADTGRGAGLGNLDRKSPPPVPSAPIPSLKVSRHSSRGSNNQDTAASFQSADSDGIPERNTLSNTLKSKINPSTKSKKKSSKASTAVDSSSNASSTDLFKSRFKFPSDIAPPSSFVNFPKVYASKIYQESRQN